MVRPIGRGHDRKRQSAGPERTASRMIMARTASTAIVPCTPTTTPAVRSITRGTSSTIT